MKLQSINPHDQSVVGELPISTKQDVEQAVALAKNAFEIWRFTPIKERISYIKKFRDLVEKHADEFAKLVTLEMGKPMTQSKDDIPWELDFIDYYIENAAVS